MRLYWKRLAKLQVIYSSSNWNGINKACPRKSQLRKRFFFKWLLEWIEGHFNLRRGMWSSARVQLQSRWEDHQGVHDRMQLSLRLALLLRTGGSCVQTGRSHWTSNCSPASGLLSNDGRSGSASSCLCMQHSRWFWTPGICFTDGSMPRPAHEEGNQFGNPLNCTTRQPIPLAIRLHPRHQKVALSASPVIQSKPPKPSGGKYLRNISATPIYYSTRWHCWHKVLSFTMKSRLFPGLWCGETRIYWHSEMQFDC